MPAFQEQGTVVGTVTLVPVASLPEERRCQFRLYSRPGSACVLNGHVDLRNELESALSSFLGPSSASMIVLDDDVKKDMGPVSPASSGLCKACNSKTRFLQAQPATSRAVWHPRPRAEDVLSKRLLFRGEVDRCYPGIAIDEK